MHTTTRWTALARVAGGLVLLVGLAAQAAAQVQSPVPTATHGAVGSYFGKAMQLCPQGVSPAGCALGLPAVDLYMTPTLTSDGIFIGNDSLALGGPPFGPHTTAHGHWIAKSPTEFQADYTFMLNTFPDNGDGSLAAVRMRWDGIVADKNTLVGWVNLYFAPPIPPTWIPLLDPEFPPLAPETATVTTSPTGFVRDPNTCLTAGCPLVFKFQVKRVAP